MKAINKKIRFILVAALCLLLMSTVSLATNTYAEAGAKWVLDGLFWVTAALGTVYGGMSLIKRNITQGVIVFIGAAIVCVICKDPTILERLGTTMKNTLGL